MYYWASCIGLLWFTLPCAGASQMPVLYYPSRAHQRPLGVSFGLLLTAVNQEIECLVSPRTRASWVLTRFHISNLLSSFLVLVSLPQPHHSLSLHLIADTGFTPIRDYKLMENILKGYSSADNYHYHHSYFISRVIDEWPSLPVCKSWYLFLIHRQLT